jgi:hypothetical protein
MISFRAAPVGPPGGGMTMYASFGQLAKRVGMATIAAMVAALARAGVYDEGAVGLGQAAWLGYEEEGCELVREEGVAGAALQTSVGVRRRRQRGRPSDPPAGGRQGSERANRRDA